MLRSTIQYIITCKQWNAKIWHYTIIIIIMIVRTLTESNYGVQKRSNKRKWESRILIKRASKYQKRLLVELCSSPCETQVELSGRRQRRYVQAHLLEWIVAANWWVSDRRLISSTRASCHRTSASRQKTRSFIRGVFVGASHLLAGYRFCPR